MTTIINNFEQQKKELLIRIQKYNNKLLFPNSLLVYLKNNELNRLRTFMKKYNYYLIQIRDYNIKLEQLNQWSYLLNTYYIWYHSINYIINKIELNNNNILMEVNYIKLIKIFNDIIHIDYKDIETFMNLIKLNNTYYNYRFNVRVEYSNKNIINLLPHCKINGNNNSLDISDILEKIL